jgi:hypothetical protein
MDEIFFLNLKGAEVYYMHLVKGRRELQAAT